MAEQEVSTRDFRFESRKRAVRVNFTKSFQDIITPCGENTVPFRKMDANSAASRNGHFYTTNTTFNVSVCRGHVRERV